jgi:hypothetical protein
MRGAIMTSGARPRSAVELLMKRLVPFEQRPAARPVVQSYEIHRGVTRLRLTPFVFLRPPFEFGGLRRKRIKKLLTRRIGARHSTISLCSRHSNAKPRQSPGHGIVGERELFYVHPPQSAGGSRVPSREREKSGRLGPCAAVGRGENFLHSSDLPDRGFIGRPAQGSVAPRKPSSGSDRQALKVTRSRMATCAPATQATARFCGR